MKNRLLLSIMGLATLVGLTSGKAEASNTYTAPVSTPGNLAAVVNPMDGSVIVTSTGQRTIYVSPGSNATVSGQYIIFDGNSYVYVHKTYGGRNASNETRMITMSTLTAESQIIGSRIEERINAAHHQQSPNQPGVFALGQGGMNSGNNPTKVGVWGMYGYSNIKDTGNVSNFKANLHSGTIGVDYLFTPCFLAGLAFNYGHINDGKYDIRKGKYEHDSYTAALYASLIAHEYVSFDAMLAYGKVHKKYAEKKVTFIRADGTVVLDSTGPDLKGSSSARRFMGNIFINGRYGFAIQGTDKINLWLRAGYAHAQDKEDSFTVSNTAWGSEDRPGGTVNLGNLSARLRAGYRIHQMVEPYIQGGVNHNVVRTKINADQGPAVNDKRFGWMVGGGFRFFPLDALSGGAQYTYNKRGDLKIHNVTADVRYDF